jgi:quinoprotein glucose dehydrogenase
MLKAKVVLTLQKGVFASLIAAACLAVHAQHRLAQTPYNPKVAPASNEGELAIKKFTVAPGLKVDLWAAEPHLANPVGFGFDERGRAYVCETFRLHLGVPDIRGIMNWLDEDLACRTVNDRLMMMKRRLGNKVSDYTKESERLKFLEDRDGDGKVEHSTVFADGFNTILDGIAASVLVRQGNVYFANIPNLWLLRDSNGDGIADFRKSLHYGYGVRVGFIGHDLHGLRFGPDGKLYFSIGDRGATIQTEGRTVSNPDSGSVFRCNPDGSELELFALGLRNPQALAFDDYGNLFTGDNNSDGGDAARWVYVVEGGDSGWRIGYQFLERPNQRGPWNAEKLWHPQFEGQAAYIVPPITNFTDGPSGLSYYPGTGLPDDYRGHFFLVDFRGGGVNSGVHTFALKPKGASFELVEPRHFLWGVLATDCQFGVDGGLYVSDWVQGWDTTGKGRIYRVHDPAVDKTEVVLETKRLIAEGMARRSLKELTALLAHPDQRVRQEAQFALADKGVPVLKTLIAAARKNSNPLARLHASWGIGQITSKFQAPSSNSEVVTALDALVALLGDADAEVRVQAAKVLGEQRFLKAYDGLIRLLGDASPRVRFFAAMSLGKLGRREAIPSLFALLRDNADKDPNLRHAAAMALTWINDVDALVDAAKDPSRSVRLGALLALRRLERSEIAVFLKDSDDAVVLEAARAINDLPISGAMGELAALLNDWGAHAAGVPVAAARGDDKSVSSKQSVTESAKGGSSAAGSVGAPPTDARGPRALPKDPFSEPLLRRVIAANFRYGTNQNATVLAQFAANGGAPAAMRTEALDALGDWPTASGRDRVTGMWRPTAFARDVKIPADATRPVIAEVLLTAPDLVRVTAANTAARLGIKEAAPMLRELVSDAKLFARVRVEALKSLALLDDAGIADAIKLALADSDETVRREATRLQAQLKPFDAAGPLAKTLETGTVGEKQAAFATLGTLQDAGADQTLAQWLDKLIAGQVPKEIQLDLIEAAGKRPAEAVKQNLASYEASKPKDDPMAEFRETLFGGDAAEGRKVFFERAEAQCLRCHKIKGEGGEVGADLSAIGSQKDRQYLLEAIVFPNKEVAPGFESVVVSLKNGTVYAGVLKSETNDELVINSPEDGVVTVKKSDIQARDKGLSAMPEGMGQILSKNDLRDLVEFLAGLK